MAFFILIPEWVEKIANPDFSTPVLKYILKFSDPLQVNKINISNIIYFSHDFSPKEANFP